MVAGDADIPVGRPLIWMDTWDENPLMAVAESEVVAEPPAVMETDMGFTANVKSDAGGGTGF